MLTDGRMSKEKDKEIKDMKNGLKLNEKTYFMIVIRAFAKNSSWDDVS
jgi:hypothetical protein